MTSDCSAGSVQSLAQAVSLAVPERARSNNHALFMLARAMKSVEGSTGHALTATEIVGAFDSWYGKTRDRGLLRQGQTRDQYLNEFLRAWRRALWPLGGGPIDEAFKRAQAEPFPPEAALFQNRSQQLLVALCHQLDCAAQGQAWFLAGRTAARLLGEQHRTVAVWISNLVALGILTIAAEHTTVKARRYRYQLPEKGTIKS